MAIAALGLNHMSAPLALRERLAFAADQVPQALASLKRIVPARHSHASLGAAILSTCNRTELYVSTDDSANVQHELQRWLAEHTGVDARQLAQHGYYLQHDQAVRHAFRVASGLDSMVLGEPQILGQLKDAVRVADQSAALGSTLSRLFQRTFSVAKEVRSSTAISSGGVSMAAATVRIAERIFESIGDCRVLLVGAGDMIDLVGTHFAAQHPKQLVVMNRSRERGAALARKLHAHYLPLAELPAQLPQFDIVVSCTASTLPIIGLGAVQRAISARRHKPMLMVDMAVPRDVEAEVGKLSDVYLYTVDDLQAWVQEGMEQRRSAVSQAEAIVNSRVQDFMQWLAKREVVPTIQAIAASSESWRQAEVDRALKLLAAGHAPTEVLEQLSHRLSHKHLHGTLASLAEAGAAEQPQLLVSAEKFFLRNDRSLHR